MAVSVLSLGAAANAGTLSDALNNAANKVGQREQSLTNAQKEAQKETQNQMNRKFVSNLIQENESIEKIARVTEIPVEKVIEIVAELKKNG